MFEVGMSALVLKICSEYAKALGLNFPPCTQQEINAICEWVDKHAVKDMTISQDGYIVTFTFKGEYDTTKEFTITIPKNVDTDELEKVLFGSNSIGVYRLPGNSGLQIKLDQSVINDINNRLTKPANPASDSVVTMTANGTVGTKPLSEIGGGGGGGKIYRHDITKKMGESTVTLSFLDSKSVALTADEISIKHSGNNIAFVSDIKSTTYNTGGGILCAIISSITIKFIGVLYADSTSGVKPYLSLQSRVISDFLSDATYEVTEI